MNRTYRSLLLVLFGSVSLCGQSAEEQLGVNVPVILVGADKDTWTEADRLPYPLPHSNMPWSASSPEVIVVPARMEDYPGRELFPDVDVDLAAEIISLHELGHLVADEALAKLENARPRISKAAQGLGGPTTLARVTAAACREQAKAGPQSMMTFTIWQMGEI